MDIANYDLRTNAEQGFAFTVVDPITRKDTDLTITIVGSDSKTFRRARTDALRDVVKAGGDFDEDQMTAQMCAACVTGWENMTENGEPVVFSVEKAVDLFARMGWLLDQVSAAIENRANFTKPVGTS